jgi:hypothetical protein
VEPVGTLGTTGPLDAVVEPSPRGWPAALRAAAFATLGMPRWWAMALAGFLVRGGLVLVVLPILTLPTVASLATALTPIVMELGLGQPSLGSIVGLAAAVLLVAGWLLGSGWIGAWLDLALIEAATRDEELDLPAPLLGTPIGQVFTARLLAHVGTVLALGYAVERLGGATYAELTSPGDPAVGLVMRVLLRAPDAPIALLAAWALGEALGGLATRRLASGDSLRRALIGGLRMLLRPASLATLVLTDLVVIAFALSFWLAATGAWMQLRVHLLDGAPKSQLGAALLLLVATWILGLTLLGAALAWRGVAWTAEAFRRHGVSPWPAADAAGAPGVS